MGIALVLTVGNVWITSLRSTIPLEINDRLIAVETRAEKHPGKDDVHLLHMESGKRIQVDQQVAAELKEGEKLEKDAWAHQIKASSRVIELTWSPDFRGMTFAMPLIFLILLLTVWKLTERGLQSPRTRR